MRNQLSTAQKALPVSAALLVAVAALGLLLAACGGGEKTVGTLTLRATDFAFEVEGDLRPGPTRIVMPNEGEYEHHAQFFRIEDDHTVDELLEAAAAFEETLEFPEWAVWMGGPGMLSPGETAEHFAEFEAGRYVFICFLDDPDGVPHAALGMVAQLDVP